MVDPFVLAGIALGSLCTLAWVVVRCVSRHRWSIDFQKCFSVFVSGAGLVVGAKVAAMSLTSKSLGAVQDERVFFFLGGAALLLLSVDSLVRTFRSAR